MKTKNPESESLWTKAPVANLVRYKPSGIYFARAKVRGKLVRKSLDTNILSVAKLRLADVVDAEHRAVAPSQTKIVGKMTFGEPSNEFPPSPNRKGQIQLKDGRVLPENYREFVRGYAITSYGSQGKTVEYVLFSDSSVKAATNNQQWLVTISRGTRAVKIFTQDKAQLRENIGRLGDRELAIEFANQDSTQARRLPPPVRKYIAGLIQSRRSEIPKQQIEKIDLWKSPSTRLTQRTRAQRI